jgi:hypothetical protein
MPRAKAKAGPAGKARYGPSRLPEPGNTSRLDTAKEREREREREGKRERERERGREK